MNGESLSEQIQEDCATCTCTCLHHGVITSSPSLNFELFSSSTSERGVGSNVALPRDCAELQYRGHTHNGVYTVYVGDFQKPVSVYCDFTNNDGGWLVGAKYYNMVLKHQIVLIVLI